VAHRVAVFASGSGSNFQALIDASEAGTLHAKICGLVTNNPDAKALNRAVKHQIPVFVINPADFSEPEVYVWELLSKLQEWNPDLIALAGYLKKVPEKVIRAYPNRMVNIHPSLLPKFGGKGFYGKRVHQAVLDAGEKESGCSVHVVTPEYDEGPVIGRATVPVKPNDTAETLAKRVLDQEHKLFPTIINQHLKTLKSP